MEVALEKTLIIFHVVQLSVSAEFVAELLEDLLGAEVYPFVPAEPTFQDIAATPDCIIIEVNGHKEILDCEKACDACRELFPTVPVILMTRDWNETFETLVKGNVSRIDFEYPVHPLREGAVNKPSPQDVLLQQLKFGKPNKSVALIGHIRERIAERHTTN